MKKRKNDPVLYEEFKRKERERYYARKNAGKIKTIDQMSSREKRAVRKDWRGRSKKCYDAKKKINEMENFIAENSPPPSPADSINNANIPVAQSQENINAIIGKRKRRKNRQILKDKIQKLEEMLRKSKRKAEKYKKRAQRLEHKTNDTPQKNVRRLVQTKKLTPEIKKKLLFCEVISKQMRENFNDKDKYRKVITGVAGKIVKKYKMKTVLSNILSQKMVTRQYKTSANSLGQRSQIELWRRDVTEFLERDEYSRLLPGKKDTITVKKNKRQKGYLNDNMLNLHKAFCFEKADVKISYTTFCRLRPFWIVPPKVTDRDTCLCVIHENMALLTNKLFYKNVIEQNSPDQLCKAMCCEGDRLKEECIERKCRLCKNKIIKIN